jgi:hypothetical protein
MSQLKVNALVSYSGNTVTLGTSGDTINVASGVTFNTASGTLTLPSTISATTINATTINATTLNSSTLNVTTVVLAAGAVGTPSLTTSGDTNTGIFFSTTDTIDFAEGGVATGQFDSSGNFKFNSGYGSVETAYGCRAWVNFNGTGTVAIRESGNVTSITDNGTGDYTVNFTTAMPDGDYGFTFGGARDTSGNECYYSAYDNGVLTTSLRVRGWSNSTVTARDMTYFCVSIFR